MKPINLFDYEALARQRIEPANWDFYQGGSDDEVTLRANRTAFERIRLRPRVLVDVSMIDMQTTVLGTPISMPIMVAPTATHRAAHPEGELATVRGVGAARTLMVASTVATTSLEDIMVAGRAMECPLWFQLYVQQDLSISEGLVRRAEAAGYRAIVLTVDLPRLGNREKDKRNLFINPPPPLQAANFASEAERRIPLSRQLTWDSIAWLRGITKLPILVKGVLTAEDAELAIKHGVDGIIVSNHGGRQLDGVPATIEALPEVVEAVGGRCEVYVDGGIRRGTDVLKALALGARAVLIGRPIIWGLAVGGSEGVTDVLDILRAELELAMMLAGRPTLASIDRSLVQIMPY